MNAARDVFERWRKRSKTVRNETVEYHEYKIKDSWFQQISKGKEFEIRKDDRPSVPKPGDIVILTSETLGDCLIRVKYVLHWKDAPEFVKEGYFIMAFRILTY